ncbi:hypothetical protein [Microbacterium sp.]|uniref:hypothetical protein n=1 Tax=Microbacterium sp. TaxID=51671 RepID=UPI0032217F0C
MAEPTHLKMLIWGKTYPELSSKHAETVCTGAVDESGRPIRLYPVPLRYLEGDQRYRLYDIVEVRADRNPRDNRPESHRIVPNSLSIVGKVPTDDQEWAGRREWICRDTSWHYDSLADLEAARLHDDTSMGLIRPGVVERVYLKPKKAAARREFEEKWESVTSQQDLFLPEYKALQYLTHEIRIDWRCAASCETCRRRPHDMMVLDWGLLELARRDGDWEKARRKLETISDLATHDFRLFIGNFFLHQQTWGVIGLWYPKRQAQQRLF